MTTQTTVLCDHVQERLAESGTQALAADPAARGHVDGCEECRAVLFALQELDATLATLPQMVPSAEVLAEIGARVAAEGPAASAPAPRTTAAPEASAAPASRRGEPRGARLAERFRRLLGGGGARAWVFALATLVVAGLAGVFATQRLGAGDSAAEAPPANQVAQGPGRDGVRLAELEEAEEMTREEGGGEGRFWNDEEDERSGDGANAGYRGGRGLAFSQQAGAPPTPTSGTTSVAPPTWSTTDPYAASAGDSGLVGAYGATTGGATQRAPLGDLLPESPHPGGVEDANHWGTLAANDDDLADEARTSTRTVYERWPEPEPSPSASPAPPQMVSPVSELSERTDAPARPAASTPRERRLVVEGEPASVTEQELGRDTSDDGTVAGDHRVQDGEFEARLTTAPPDVPAARQLLAARARTEGLTFVEPAGYWANTYVPGDPVLRDLQRRLGGTPEAPGVSAAAPETALALAERARTYDQPFDLPGDSAIAVYLSSDRAAAQGETRALVQVGIQGSRRETGRRPAMNLSVVLDLSDGADPGDRASIDALLGALSEAHEVGDRFSLVVAGQPGGALIAPGRFGYGEVLVAREALWGEGEAASGAPLALDEAFGVAAELVAASDDPDAVLGSSLVLLVTPGTLDDEAEALGRLAHRAAVAGVPTSVVGVGDGVSLAELDGVALAGQGTRRLLRSEDDAARVASEELAAASRIVARAVRLRIRLAPGVRLVDVLGSYRLDAGSAERVREAENAIDQRLARSLGIEADRGEDEDGIQIVIPAFYAEDTHVILLDVVTEGAGPLAEVSVRYKDLVHLRNGVARASLDLERGERAPGPLQRNVLKNLLAFELSRALADAGTLLWSGDGAAAAARLDGFVGVVQGLRAEVPGFDADPEILADLELLSGYLAAIEGAGGTVAPTTIADSLLYASRRKLITPNDLGGNP
jgi:hypothetical protein